jgi:hypothetical protein
MACLARVMRRVIVASGTRNARAISAVDSPPSARSVSAICEAGDSEGWQHRNSRISAVGPVHVLHDQDHGLLLGERFQQRQQQLEQPRAGGFRVGTRPARFPASRP